MTKTNGTAIKADKADELAEAQAAYAAAMKTVAQGIKLLQTDLQELAEATRDMRRLGKLVVDYPEPLALALAATMAKWGQTGNGREALGLPPPLTTKERDILAARAALAHAEERLAKAKAIQPVTDDMIADRRKLIENAAESVVKHKKLVVALEPSSAAEFRNWLKGFARDVRAWLQESPRIERPELEELIRAERQADAREAAKADPLGYMIGRELGNG
jgi:hypothetical protein